jgi:cell division protein FtsZ
MPERRARMLDESTTPPARNSFAGDFEVPIRQRVNTRPTSVVPFASEVKEVEPIHSAEPVVEQVVEPEIEAVAADEQPNFASALYAALNELETLQAQTPAIRAAGEPELVPVPASVFDDEFFRTTYVRKQREAAGQRSAVAVAAGPIADEETRVDLSGEVESFEYASVAPTAARMFAGAEAGNHFKATSPEENDELDIPAFLRKAPRS